MSELSLRSYRYRTDTLLGPWRSTSEEAARDAMRARQARLDEDGVTWHWTVPGIIEERACAGSWNDNVHVPPPERRRA